MQQSYQHREKLRVKPRTASQGGTEPVEYPAGAQTLCHRACARRAPGVTDLLSKLPAIHKRLGYLQVENWDE